jgi:GGDEF domain-containing protein
VGWAGCHSPTDPMKLVHEADEAMYEAKRAARAVRDMTANK